MADDGPSLRSADGGGVDRVTGRLTGGLCAALLPSMEGGAADAGCRA